MPVHHGQRPVPADLQLRTQAGVADRGGPDQERFGNLTQCAELLFGMGFGSWPAVGRRSWPVVVGIADRRVARGTQFVLGHDHPGRGLDQADRPVIDDDGHLAADQPGGHRVAGRGIPDTRQPVDLTQRRCARSARSDGNGRSTSRSTISRSSGIAQISECISALTSVHHAAAALRPARPGAVDGGLAGTARSRWRSRTSSPRCPSIPDPRHDRNPARTRNGSPTGHIRQWESLHSPPHRP